MYKKKLNQLRERVRQAKGLYELKEAYTHYVKALRSATNDSALIHDMEVLRQLIEIEEK